MRRQAARGCNGILRKHVDSVGLVQDRPKPLGNLRPEGVEIAWTLHLVLDDCPMLDIEWIMPSSLCRTDQAALLPSRQRVSELEPDVRIVFRKFDKASRRRPDPLLYFEDRN